MHGVWITIVYVGWFSVDVGLSSLSEGVVGPWIPVHDHAEEWPITVSGMVLRSSMRYHAVGKRMGVRYW